FSMPFEETMKWTLFMTEHAYQPIKTDTIKFDAVYELTNVELDVDVGEGASAQTKLMAAAASGKMYDITYINNTQFRTYKTSLFYDLTDRIKTDLPNYYAAVKDEWEDLMLFSTGGRLYGFAQKEYKYLYDEQGVLGVYVRVDVLEDNNIKKPTTWKEWFEAMKVLKKKYPNSQPYASRTYDYCLRYWTQQLGQAYQIYYNSKTEKWECGVLNAAKFKNVLQFMKDCYDEGVLDQNFDQSSDKNWLDMAIATQTFTTVDSGPLVAQANEQLQKNNKNAEFVMIAPLASHINNGGTTSWYWPQSINFQSMYYISSQAQNLDELLYFMDWCYTEEGANTNNYGKLHETYEIDKDGMAYVPEKLWKQKWPTGGNNNVYEWMSAFGLNQLCFAPLMNNNDQRWENWDWAPEEDNHEWQMDGPAEYAKGYALAQFNLSPDVDAAMTARYDTIQVYLRNQVIAFVKGNRPISEFDTFVNDLKAMGVEELLAACNA
ncbi:MAG: extracellular solute-binding protein, partial [Clostridia bacterium]|nr:extracellular solute-binding protein [Clostridia bacterium]